MIGKEKSDFSFRISWHLYAHKCFNQFVSYIQLKLLFLFFSFRSVFHMVNFKDIHIELFPPYMGRVCHTLTSGTGNRDVTQTPQVTPLAVTVPGRSGFVNRSNSLAFR